MKKLALAALAVLLLCACASPALAEWQDRYLSQDSAVFDRAFAQDAPWNNWQGYLLDVGLGGREGPWAWANLGVLFALVIGFVVTYVARRGKVARQEGRA